jgi:hypothetical protein
MEYKDTSHPQIMQEHIVACKLSGLTVAAYCGQHQLKVNQYYYWQKKLQPPSQGNFIKLAPALASLPVSIVFANGNQVNFAVLPPADYVKQLVS